MVSSMILGPLALALSLAPVGIPSPAYAKPCELHVWAEGNAAGPAPDPRNLNSAERSIPKNILDPGQRLYQMSSSELIAALALPSDTKVVIHTEKELLGKQAEKTSARLTPSDATCYMDWTFRPDTVIAPTPLGSINALVIRNYGQLSFYSIFKAYGATGGPYLTVKGLHRGRLPVLSGKDERMPVYDTAFGTHELVQNAAAKIRLKLNVPSLTQSYPAMSRGDAIANGTSAKDMK
jgi:hypothetical protein